MLGLWQEMLQSWMGKRNTVRGRRGGKWAWVILKGECVWNENTAREGEESEINGVMFSVVPGAAPLMWMRRAAVLEWTHLLRCSDEQVCCPGQDPQLSWWETSQKGWKWLEWMFYSKCEHEIRMTYKAPSQSPFRQVGPLGGSLYDKHVYTITGATPWWPSCVELACCTCVLVGSLQLPPLSPKTCIWGKGETVDLKINDPARDQR